MFLFLKMRKAKLLALSLLIFAVASCDDFKNHELSLLGFEKIDANKKSQEQFLVRLSELNLEIIELGNYIQKNSKTNFIQSLVSKEVQFSTQMQREIIAIANRELITIPSTQAKLKYKFSKNSKFNNQIELDYLNQILNKILFQLVLIEKTKTETLDIDVQKFKKQYSQQLNDNARVISDLITQNITNL